MESRSNDELNNLIHNYYSILNHTLWSNEMGFLCSEIDCISFWNRGFDYSNNNYYRKQIAEHINNRKAGCKGRRSMKKSIFEILCSIFANNKGPMNEDEIYIKVLDYEKCLKSMVVFSLYKYPNYFKRDKNVWTYIGKIPENGQISIKDPVKNDFSQQNIMVPVKAGLQNQEVNSLEIEMQKTRNLLTEKNIKWRSIGWIEAFANKNTISKMDKKIEEILKLTNCSIAGTNYIKCILPMPVDVFEHGMKYALSMGDIWAPFSGIRLNPDQMDKVIQTGKYPGINNLLLFIKNPGKTMFLVSNKRQIHQEIALELVKTIIIPGIIRGALLSDIFYKTQKIYITEPESFIYYFSMNSPEIKRFASYFLNPDKIDVSPQVQKNSIGILQDSSSHSTKQVNSGSGNISFDRPIEKFLPATYQNKEKIVLNIEQLAELDIKHIQPIRFWFSNYVYGCSNFQRMFSLVIELLYEKFRDSFIKNAKGLIIRDNPETLLFPQKIGNHQLFFENNRKGKEALLVIVDNLKAFGYKPDNFEIEFSLLDGYRPQDNIILNKPLSSKENNCPDDKINQDIHQQKKNVIELNMEQIEKYDIYENQIKSFVFKGQRYGCSKWRKLLSMIMNLIYKEHGFELFLTGENDLLKNNPNKLNCPERIEKSSWYVETYLSAKETISFLLRVLREFRYKGDDFKLQQIVSSKFNYSKSQTQVTNINSHNNIAASADSAEALNKKAEKSVDLSLFDLKGKYTITQKPVSISIQNFTIYVESWQDCIHKMLSFLCLADKKLPKELSRIALISKKSFSNSTAVKLSGSEYFVDSNLTASASCRLLSRIIKVAGHSEKDITLKLVDKEAEIEFNSINMQVNKKTEKPPAISVDNTSNSVEKKDPNKAKKDIYDNELSGKSDSLTFEYTLSQLKHQQLSFTKPIWLKIGNKEFYPETWIDCLLETLCYLKGLQSDFLEKASIATSFVTKNPNALLSPRKIENSEFYVEANRNSNGLVSYLSLMVKTAGLDPDTVLLRIKQNTRDKRAVSSKLKEPSAKTHINNVKLTIPDDQVSAIHPIIESIRKDKGNRIQWDDFIYWIKARIDNGSGESSFKPVLRDAGIVGSDNIFNEDNLSDFVKKSLEHPDSPMVRNNGHVYEKNTHILQFSDNNEEKIIALLKLAKEPQNCGDLCDGIRQANPENIKLNEYMIRQIIKKNNSGVFIRTSKEKYGLREWNIPEWDPAGLVYDFIKDYGKPIWKNVLIRELCENGDLSEKKLDSILNGDPGIEEISYQEYGLAEWNKTGDESQILETPYTTQLHLNGRKFSELFLAELDADELGRTDLKRLDLIMPIVVKNRKTTMFDIVSELIEEQKYREIAELILGKTPSSPEAHILSGKDVCLNCTEDKCFKNLYFRSFEEKKKYLIDFRNKKAAVLQEDIWQNPSKEENYVRLIEFPLYMRFLVNFQVVILKQLLTKWDKLLKHRILYKDNGIYCPFEDVWEVSSEFHNLSQSSNQERNKHEIEESNISDFFYGASDEIDLSHYID